MDSSSISHRRQGMQYHQETKALFVIDNVKAMKRKEQTTYLYENYFKAPSQRRLHKGQNNLSIWREKICHWTFSVIDHFELSRKTVAISIDLFDRYLATQGNQCDDRLALLVSLATLYIAIKIHEEKKIKLETLAELSRSQFCAEDIEEMEYKILHSLSWLVHPPTNVDFMSLLLKFLPSSVSMPLRHKIFEVSRYMAELSVCDPYFIEHRSSTIAFASITNVLEDEKKIDAFCKSRYFQFLQEELGFRRDSAHVRAARDRLRTLVETCGVSCEPTKDTFNGSQNSKKFDYRPPEDCPMETSSSPSSTTDPRVVKSPRALSRSRCHKNNNTKTRYRSDSHDSRSSLSSRGSGKNSFFRSCRINCQ